MIKYLVSIYILLFSTSLAFAQLKLDNEKNNFDGDIVMSLPWNTVNGLVEKSTIEGSFGSTSFTSLGNNRVAFLNELQNEISVFENSKEVKKFNSRISPTLGLKFINDKFYAIGINECSVINSNGELIEIIKLTNKIPSVKNIVNIGEDVFFVSSNQDSYLYKDQKLTKYTGIPITRGVFAKAIKHSENIVEIKITKDNNYVKSFSFNTDEKLSSLKIIGGTKDRLFFDVEFIKQEKPLIAQRKIFAVSISSSSLDIIDNIILPNSYFLSLRNDLEFVNGSVYYFLTTPELGSIYKLQLNSQTKQKVFDENILSSSYHFNNNIKEVSFIKLNKSLGRDSIVDPISRKEIISRAEAFESHIWTATADNIWTGQICDNQQVIAAPYVKVGENRSVPYMWDGFSSIEKFDEGMSNGLCAGNKNTSTSVGSMNCAEGVDCSGFISQAWNTTWKYDTREFYPIVIDYDSWSELKPGDVANKPGHIRLFHSWNDDGTMHMLEATSRDNVWRVVYNDYSISEMQSKYTPGYLYSVYEETALIKNNEVFNNSIKVFPNPVVDSFKIVVELEQFKKGLVYEIINAKGQILMSGNIDGKPISFKNYKTGMYFARISSSDFSVVKKIYKK